MEKGNKRISRPIWMAVLFVELFGLISESSHWASSSTTRERPICYLAAITEEKSREKTSFFTFATHPRVMLSHKVGTFFDWAIFHENHFRRSWLMMLTRRNHRYESIIKAGAAVNKGSLFVVTHVKYPRLGASVLKSSILGYFVYLFLLSPRNFRLWLPLHHFPLQIFSKPP